MLWIRFLRVAYSLIRYEGQMSAKTGAILAVHYGEGVDLTKRNEIFWYPESNISNGRVIIYFDSNSQAVTQEVLDNINAMKIRWVCLNSKPMKSKGVKLWRPYWGVGSFVYHYDMVSMLNSRNVSSKFDGWIVYILEKLIFNISYWYAFYTAFGIKLQIEIEERGEKNIAESIAIDFVDGILVGRQRSEYSICNGDIIGFFPQHIFFGWNKRLLEYIVPPMNTVNNLIISGYCYDYIFKKNKGTNKYLREQLNEKGVKFVVALFDNTFNRYTFYSAKMLEMFYKTFIDWLISDKEIGLILKPKKAFFLEKYLPNVMKSIKQAQNTGRCILYPDSLGRFPSDVSQNVDMVVGIGISTAVIEAVVAGTKGIFYDSTKCYSSLFYKIGYKKIIFDDLKELINILEKYKKNPEQEMGLGDFSQWIGLLDPYRDGNAAERIGVYLRWCLEGFDAGMNRNDTIKQANKMYMAKWGNDKVLSPI